LCTRHKDKQNNNNTKHSIETQTELKKWNEAKTKYYNIWHLMFKNEIKHPTGSHDKINTNVKLSEWMFLMYSDTVVFFCFSFF
jgi:hypothetical protein